MKDKKLCLHDACSEGNKQMNILVEIDEICSKFMHGRVGRDFENLLNLL
jgi:hypothetical protein